MADLFFPTTDDLLAALRLCDDPESWRQPAVRYALGQPDQPAWLLRLERLPAGLPAEPVAVTIAGTTVTLALGTATRALAVVAELTAPSLLQTVPLVRWAKPQVEVAFVRLASRELFREAARSCLMLGNDRMRYLPLGEGRFLLRIEGLSAFLREKWRADPGVELFHPADPEARILVPWGFDFPLADKLQLVPGDESLLWLIEADGTWRQLQGVLADIYERVEVDPRLLLTSEPRAADEVPTVRVELRLEPTDAPEQAQLWWLGPTERPVLEQLLREAGEAELNSLQLAVIEQPEGERSYLVVERVGAPSGLAPPIHGGRLFFARLPVEHLYLPVGLRLAPLLSRRSLIEALGLGDDHLTLVSPAEAGRLQISRIPRAALRPLPELLDYFAAESGESVRALLERVTVDYDLAQESGDEPPATPAPTGWWANLRRWLGG